METSSTDWQTWAALAVVAGTAVIFAVRIALRRGKSGSCGTGCGCGAAKPKVK